MVNDYDISDDDAKGPRDTPTYEDIEDLPSPSSMGSIKKTGMTRAQKMTKDLLAILRFLPSQRQDVRLANNFLKSQISPSVMAVAWLTTMYILTNPSTASRNTINKQWEKERTASFIYLSYRLWHALTVTSLLLLSLIEVGKPVQTLVHYAKWPIYLTNWGLMLNVLQAYIAVHLVYNAHSAILKGDDSDSGLKMSSVYRIYWCMSSCSVTIAFGVTAMYWVFIYDPGHHELDVPNLASHLLNSVVMGIDFLVVGHPFELAHCIYPLIFVSAYVIFNLLYYVFGGLSRDGTVTLYVAMDWRSPVSCLKFVVGGYVVVTSVHIFFCVAYVVKRKAAHSLKWRRYVRENANGTCPTGVERGDCQQVSMVNNTLV